MAFKLVVSAVILTLMCLVSACSAKLDSPVLPRPIFEMRLFMPREAKPAVVAQEHEPSKF